MTMSSLLVGEISNEEDSSNERNEDEDYSISYVNEIEDMLPVNIACAGNQ